MRHPHLAQQFTRRTIVTFGDKIDQGDNGRLTRRAERPPIGRPVALADTGRQRTLKVKAKRPLTSRRSPGSRTRQQNC